MNGTTSHVLYACKQFIHSRGRMVSRKEKEKTLGQRQRKKEYIATSANTQQKVRKEPIRTGTRLILVKICVQHIQHLFPFFSKDDVEEQVSLQA